MLSCLSACAIAAPAESLADVPNVAQVLLPQWQQFSQQAARQASTVVTQPLLNQFPQGLLLSRSRYPMTQEYGWSALLALYRFSRDCSSLAAKRWPRELDKAYRFEAMLCQGKPLTAAQLQPFLTQAPLRYPAGGSYADRYLRWLHAQGLSAQATALQTQYANWFSVETKAHPLHHEFMALSPSQRDQLLRGDSWVMDNEQRVWLSDLSGLRRLEKSQWQAFARKAGIELVALDSVAVCPLPVGSLCVLPLPAPFPRWWWLWGALMLSALWVLRLLWLRRRAAQERRFILQLLTHELRTPVASLSLALETLRAEYDALSATGQQALGRVLGDAARLARVTRTSQAFLSLSGAARWPVQTVMLDEWLDSVTEKYTDLISVDVAVDSSPTTAVPITVPAYWLGLCVDNLLRNALQHGRAPITLRVRLSATVLRLTVEDHGVVATRSMLRNLLSGLVRYSRAWRMKDKPAPTASEAGMGIGLFLVRRMMQRAGGRLRVQRHPTRYTLELPR